MKALLALLSTTCLCFTCLGARADIISFRLDGKGGEGLLATNENGAINGTPGSGGIGSGGITLNTDTNEIFIDVRWGTENGFTNLTGAVSAMHIHGATAQAPPAGFSQDAGVLVGLPGFNPSASNGSFVGTVSLTQAQEDAIVAGRAYLNIHTALNGGGEIRGHLIAIPQPVILFSQDFEMDLGPDEKTFGSFSINDTHTALNNGTRMMGHSEAYGPLGGAETPPQNLYAYYEVEIDLRGFLNAELRFDLTGGIEKDYDGLNLVASTTGQVSPPDGLLTPTAGSPLQYGAIILHAASSPQLGPTAWFSPADPSVVTSVSGIFDLTHLTRQKATIRFQFGTDGLEGGDGANIDNIVVTGTAAPDTDGDGMPDWYEIANGQNRLVDDSGGDLDEDGLTNLREFELCTDPNNTDSDGDGYPDNIESNSGVFLSLADPGTNPARADTDFDGLDDGVETNTGVYVSPANTGTDPHNPDTDGDGFEDGIDPDPTNPSIVPSVIAGGSPFTTTHVWNAGTMNLANAEAVTADDSQVGDRLVVTTPYIHFHDNANPPAFLDLSRPFPLWDPENGGAGFGDREDFAVRSVDQINVRQPGGVVTFVCNSDDGFSLRIDGTEVGSAGDRGRTDTLMEVTLTPGLHDIEFIYWERGGGAGVTVAVHRSFGGGAPAFTIANEMQWELLTAFQSTHLFEISEVELADGTMTITWPSINGEFYVIEESLDLRTWVEIDDSWPSAGESTSFEATVPTPTPDAFYLRVKSSE